MHGRAFQIRVFTVGQRRSSHVVFSAQASRERGTVVPAACTSPPCGDKPALDAMASQGSVGSAPSGAALVPWNEDVLTVPAFRSVIEEFLSASRRHPECVECCNTELENTRYFMRFLMCNTNLAGRLEYEEERPAYYAGWWWAERVRFVRLEECSRVNDVFCTRRARLRRRIVTRARRHAANHEGDLTPRMREEILFDYIQGHSACVGNPMDWGLPPLQRWATRWIGVFQ